MGKSIIKKESFAFVTENGLFLNHAGQQGSTGSPVQVQNRRDLSETAPVSTGATAELPSVTL